MENAVISKIKAEIDKRYAEYREKMKSDDFTYYEGMADALDLFEQFIDSLESEKPINLDDAMKELDEKIALVKERGTWEGVDVDKYMDDVRGREPEKPMNLEELMKEAQRYYSDNFDYISSDQPTLSILTNIARHFAEWGAEHAKECEECPSRGNTHSYLKGLEDGKKEMKEQMMKEAVETKVFMSFAPGHNQMVMADVDLPTNTKVRIIIVKEDEK